MTTSATTATVNNNAVNNKIQDFGQKIGGARKDLAAAAMDLAAVFAGITPDSLKALQLSKLAQFSKVEKLAASGAISEECARACFALWRTIDSKPATSWKVSSWAQKTAAVLARIAELVAGGEISEDVRALPDFRVLTAANYPAEAFSFGRYTVVNYSPNHYSFLATVQRCDGLAVVGGNYYRLKATTGTAEENAQACAAFIRENTAKEKQQRSEGATFELWSSCGKYYAAPKGRNKIRVKEWNTREEAREGMKDTAALREAWDKIRNTPALRRTTNRERIGEDYRQGVDVTPESFAEAFAFRGVEFGNWLTQADRLTRLNETFDSLRDLCALVGINADAVTLRGWLAMAFGSRGIPGAAAHFEHSHQVINLTKEHGAGSLAHEWLHALDAFTASRLGCGFGMMAINNYANLPEGEEKEAARALYKALYNSPFARRSEMLDYYKNKAYYGTITEMAARAFECYIIELAGLRGWVCDFLANVTTPEAWSAFYGSMDCYPYPTREELAELAPAFARFLSVVCDAEELSKDAAQLFEEGRQKMEQQKEEQKQKEAESLEEQRQERAKVHEAERLQMVERLQNVAAECGAAWSFVFDSGRWYGLVGGAGFVGLVYPSGATAWRTVRENARIKKHVRGVYGRILEVRPGVNLEEFARRDLAHGFNGYSEINKAWANTYAKTWEEFAAENAEELSKASKAQQEAENRAQELAKVAEATTAKDEQKKATEGATEAKKEQKGNRPEVDTTAAPADGLQLVEISGGVAVIGDTRTTYRNRREIKAHGATWNKTAQRWEATEADKVAQLRAWFAQDEQTNEEATEEATEAPQSTEPDTVGAGAAYYSACENSPISEKSGTPSASAFPDWCVFEFGDLDCNSYAPRWCTSFKTEDEARQWVENCANGTGAMSPDAIDVLHCAGGFWMVWHSKRNGGYYCQFVAQRASVGDLSGALLTADALNLRAKLFDLKRDHMARHEVATLEAMKAGELYAVEYEGEGVTVEPDSANAGRFVATWWSRGAVQERHTDLEADQAARVVADFVCADIPATVWARERLLLRVLKVSELPYYSACENSPILQNVECPDLPALPAEERKKAATMTRRDLRAHWHPFELGAYILAYAWATDRPFALMESAVIHAAQQEGTWQAPDGWRISCEREQLEPYGSAYHLRYYSSTGELQEHVTVPLYQDAVKAACVFAFKHSESRTEQRAKKERPAA